jgi:hypothetical protein
MKVKYYSGDKELSQAFPVTNEKFIEIGGIKSKHNYYDSIHRMAGNIGDIIDVKNCLPITRKIYYKSNPSLHICDARCMNAKGHDCECQCGGKNHGINS